MRRKRTLPAVLTFISAIACLVVGGFAFYLIAGHAATPTETNLLAMLLTLASLIVSWIISREYGRRSSDATIRDHSVQVGNSLSGLKNQIQMLLEWVTRQRGLEDFESTKIFDSKFDHVEQTLLAMQSQINTALQGIGGIIGDSERQHTLLMTQLAELIYEKKATEEAQHSAVSPQLEMQYERKVQDLERQIGILTSVHADPAGIADLSRKVMVACPSCGKASAHDIALKFGSSRRSTCKSCQREFDIHATPTGVAARLLAGSPAPASGLQYGGDIDLFSPPGFDFNPEDARLLARTLESVLRMHKEELFTPNSLIDSLDGSVGLEGFSKSKIRRYVQLIFWGRLFEFDTPASFSSTVTNTAAISEHDILKAFFRSIGYRAGVRRLPLNEGDLEKQIKSFWGMADAAFKEAFLAGFRQAGA